ncbi:hypothetical protein MalM25_29150 [Planctomycetes bacterium MalM25]|nr:hypothetical protein MalM25_29150 [Planctomycetes bacterium MalM25]
MKARLIGATAMAVCATAVSASFADSPKKTAEADLRLAAAEPPRGRFEDERYLLSPAHAAWVSLTPSEGPTLLRGRSDEAASMVWLGTLDRPTGLIDEVLFRGDLAWRLPAVNASRRAARGVGLADWSGLAITSTVGE